MKILIKIANFFLEIALFLLILASFFVLLTSKTNVIKGIRSFVVISGSMQPTLEVGSVIVTFPRGHYKLGDVVAFSNKAGQVVTHRIVDRASLPEGNFYETRGDANNVADEEPLEQKNIIGRSVLVVPYFGRLVNYLKTPKGFIGLVIAPTSLFILWELWSIKKEVEKEIEKKYQYRYHKLHFT